MTGQDALTAGHLATGRLGVGAAGHQSAWLASTVTSGGR